MCSVCAPKRQQVMNDAVCIYYYHNFMPKIELFLYRYPCTE